MKRIQLTLPVILLVLAALPLRAQNSWREEISRTPAKGYGIYYVSDFPDRDLTPAPKGYKPFYISTYSRHGSRYILSEGMYTDIHSTLEKASRGRLLTARGEAFRERFESVYPSLKDRSGALTPLGWQQHRAIAARLYDNYPAVWKERTHIEARSTNLPRVIMSMNACLEMLQQKNARLNFNATCSKAEIGYLNPHSGLARDYVRKDANSQYMKGNSAAWQEEMMSLFRSKVDCKGFISRLFTNGSIVDDPEGFMLNCYYLAGDMYSLPELDTWFDDLFTEEDILGLWEADNYLYYSQKGPDPLYTGRGMEVAWQMIDDIIVKADADMADGRTAARLRFGHDGCMMALLAFMGIDRWGEVVPKEQAAEVWQTYRVPMASTFQFVFYRSRRSDRILVKMLHNEQDVTLPFPAVEGPYYDWEAFKTFYQKHISSAQALLATLDPLTLKPCTLEGCVTCGGKGVEGVAVTDGVRIVRTDAQGRYRFSSDKHQGLVYITPPSGYRPVDLDGIQGAFYARLTAPAQELEVHDFVLEEEDQMRYSVLFLPDAHLSNTDFKPELESFRDIAMPLIRAQAARLKEDGPVYTMQLGDLSHDIYWYKYDFNLSDVYGFIRDLGYPTRMYSVSGNHDNDPSVTTDHTDFDAEWVYRSVFGPEYYSVDIGGDHWIFLDDIIYINVPGKGKKSKGVKGDRSYDKGLTADAWSWLEQDVAGLSSSTPVRICVHAPLVYHNASGTIFTDVEEFRRLEELFERFGSVKVYAGHVHRFEILTREEWPVFEEYELPAASGIMWTTRPNRVLSGGGEDAGIFVGRYSAGKPERHEYHTYLHGEKAMRLYDMNAVRQRYASDKQIRAMMKAFPEHIDYADAIWRNVILVNYWLYRPGETVEMLEDGKPLEVERIDSQDPLQFLNYQLADYLQTGTPHAPSGNSHLFSARASGPRKSIVVRVRDARGNLLYEENLSRPGTFDENM